MFLAFASFSVSAEEVGNYEKASDAFADALRAGETSFSLEKFNIRKSDVGFLLQYSQCQNADVFWYPESISYTFSENSEYVSEITWENSFEDFSEIEQMQKEFQRYADEAYNVCFEYGMSDFDKVISAHDYLTETASYELTDDLSFTAYGIFVRQKGVCQGYAYAFKYLMDRAGVECHYVTSDTLNHGWNIVKLDGKYYHVDVTEDDAGATYKGLFIERGRESHEKLLASDKAMALEVDDLKIWSTIPLPTCDSEIYDNAYFKDVKGTMEYINGSWYFVEPNQYINGSRRVMVANGTDVKPFWESQKAVFSVASHGDLLYCSVDNTVYQLTLDGKATEFCSTVGEVFGCNIHMGYLYYSVQNKKYYSLCAKSLPKNVDCIDSVSLEVSSRGQTLNFFVRAFDEIKGGTIKYQIADLSEEIGIEELSSSGVISIPVEPSQINEKIILTVTCDEYEKTYEISLAEYAEYILSGDFDEKTKNVVDAFLNYCEYTNYAPENEIFSEVEKEICDLSEEISYVGTTVEIGATVTLRHKFSVIGTAEFQCNGKYTVEKDGLYYVVSIMDISPYIFHRMYTVKTKDVSLKYSVLTFINECEDDETKKMLCAFYEYGMALSNYRQ